jgi:hypothetical protein
VDFCEWALLFSREGSGSVTAGAVLDREEGNTGGLGGIFGVR